MLYVSFIFPEFITTNTELRRLFGGTIFSFAEESLTFTAIFFSAKVDVAVNISIKTRIKEKKIF